ncbi:MAG: hypothetical protein IPI18_21990 [Saprospiraceae bacterium]|nr:hypothetical protein [Saprospiraceae bacterium]
MKRANFVIENREKATLSQISLANSILNKPVEKDLSERFTEVTLDKLPSLLNPEPIRIKIRETKAF